MTDLLVTTDSLVFAMPRYDMSAGLPCIFRSYQGVANQMPDCAIWEALCASMAHPELFKGIDIGESEMRKSFVEGGMECGNPIEHTIAEANTLFPHRHVTSIMSIGAGHACTIQTPKPSHLHRMLPTNVLVVMKNIAIENERAEHRTAVRLRPTKDVYFRFNVDQGIQNFKLRDWERLSEVSAHAHEYLRQVETSGRMDRAVKAIMERNAAVSMTQIGTSIYICSPGRFMAGNMH
jgi:predicted acylesterase/phospholipase RssA